MNVWLLCCLCVVIPTVAGYPTRIPYQTTGWLPQKPYGYETGGSGWSRTQGLLPLNHDRHTLSGRDTRNPHKNDSNTTSNNAIINTASNQQFSCTPLSYGLSPGDCAYMASIGMLSQGTNAHSPSAPPPPPTTGTGTRTADTSPNPPLPHIWIGSEGPNRFTFVNGADVPIILILWHMAPYDDQASFMNARVPAISYSLPGTGDAVAVSIANNVPGGWAAIYNRTTPLSEYGQVSNTFGEFSTGSWATIDVSRLVNMSGDPMTVTVQGSQSVGGVGCVSDMSTCVYTCNSGTGNSCGAAGTYSLLNCEGPNAVQSSDDDGNPTGGCQGWSGGGNIEIVMTRNGQA